MNKIIKEKCLRFINLRRMIREQSSEVYAMQKERKQLEKFIKPYVKKAGGSLEINKALIKLKTSNRTSWQNAYDLCFDQLVAIDPELAEQVDSMVHQGMVSTFETLDVG